MKAPSYLLVLFLFSLSYCRHPHPQSLPAFPIEINTARDTVLHTPNGGLVKIGSHSLSAANAARVRLTIRQDEKYFYISPAEGQPASIRNTIYVALPATASQNKWLYKGAPDSTGHLSFWKDPQPLFSRPPPNNVLHGQKLFAVN